MDQSDFLQENKKSGEEAMIEQHGLNPVIIENVEPEINGGRFAAKTIVNSCFTVEADIYREGHDRLRANLLYRKTGEEDWKAVPMQKLENDRWGSGFIPKKLGYYYYTIEAYVDPLGSWIEFANKKCPAYEEIKTDLEEGLRLMRELEQAAGQAGDREKIEEYTRRLELSQGASEEILRIIREDIFLLLATKYPLKRHRSFYHRELELAVDRKQAEFGAWYELFPRSQGKMAGRSGTFRDCIRRLPDIKRMGFDVIYLPPIHPIGRTNRKGRNNSLKTEEGDPGSPWAIGGKEGGHKAVHPDLGTLENFREFVQAAEGFGIEIALDLAYQCSPDHPYVKAHPEWFYRRPDGTIRFAENPPKKYEDIYPINFYGENQQALWEELKSVIVFWIKQGVKIFRVDNPHTKPLCFWEWVLREIRTRNPEVIFLAEAFTRPKVMKYLAKAGFSQSYTYFTWRNAKWELREYLQELTRSEMRHYFKGNFFANTPDILHEFLQKGGPGAFRLRLVLAATLCSNYGIYSGYEFCENTPLREGAEEYLDSEKYEIKVRDWNQPGNIKDLIGRVNRIRRDNPALSRYSNLRFFHSANDQVLCYGKYSDDLANLIVVVVNLDPYHCQEDTIHLPIGDWGIENWQTYKMKDLLTGEQYYWKGEYNYIRLDPEFQPAHIFKILK